MSEARSLLPWHLEHEPAFIEITFSQLEKIGRQLVLPLPGKPSAAPAEMPIHVYHDGRCTVSLGGAEVSLLHGSATLWPPSSQVMWLRFLLAICQPHHL